MGLFDEIKDKAEELKDKAVELVQGHSDQVDDAADKALGPVPSIHFANFPREVPKREIKISAGDFVDEMTGGQFADKVDLAQEKVKQVADDLDQAN